jgi:polyisoprenoid-binding protein YceI
MADLSQLTPGTWTVDPRHSTVGSVAKHLMITKVRGRFNDVEGTITIAPNPLDSKVEATVNLASVSTGDAQRDEHLVSPDFFDVERYPTMTFTTTAVKEDGSDYRLFGDLTVHGVTRAVDFDLEFEGVTTDPWGGTRASFSAEADINRRDFGLEWNTVLETGGLLVSDKVKVQLDIQAVKVEEG